MAPRTALVIAAVAVVLTSLYVNLVLGKREVSVPREALSSFPRDFEAWAGSDRQFPGRILENLGVDEYIMRRFTNGEDEIWMYMGYYRSQKEGAVPHSPRHCYPGAGFNPTENRVIEIPVDYPGKKVISPNLYIFARGLEREVVIYWYQSRGRVIANEYTEKFYLIRDSILRNRSDGALVRFSIRTRAEDVDKAVKDLTSFVAAIYPRIPRVVPD